MVKQNKTKRKYLLGYRAEGIKLYTTPLKTPGKIWAGLGYVFVVYGVVTLPLPTGSIGAIGLGVSMLGLVGIKLNIKKKMGDKVRLFKYKRGLI